MLKISGLSKSFKKKKVLKNINIEMNYGNIYGFVGENGSGKSVFFKVICGFLKSDKGKVVINNKIIGKDIDFLPDLGVLMEKPGFIEEYNQYQNLKYLAQIKKKIGDKEINDILEIVGLDLENKDKVKNFSLGMRQRLGIAQAIMENQKIIILDEPFNGLDKSGRNEIKEIILHLKSKNRLIMITSHIDGDIDDLADYCYSFKNGELKLVNSDLEKN